MSTATYRAIKADFDSKSSFYNIEIGERDQEGISREVRRIRAERVEARKKSWTRFRKTSTTLRRRSMRPTRNTSAKSPTR